MNALYGNGYHPDELTTGLLAELVHQRFGMDYSGDKTGLLWSKVVPLAQHHGFDSVADYITLLQYGADRETEWQRLQETLAIHETYFWREYDQIQAACTVVLPELARARPGQPLRIWHAGCATGEEPYSLVISLLEQGAYLQSAIEIFASDLSQAALEKARKGIYRERALRRLPAEILERYFTPYGAHEHQLDAAVRARVRFEPFNLVDADWRPFQERFDIIFCRNVFIYFSDAVITRVAGEFYRALKAPGYLMLGAAESLLRLRTAFQFTDVDGAFAYCKPVDARTAAGGERR